MLAKVKQDCGINGLSILVYAAGQTIEIEPYVGPYGEVCEELFIDAAGRIWPIALLVFEIPLPAADLASRPNGE